MVHYHNCMYAEQSLHFSCTDMGIHMCKCTDINTYIVANPWCDSTGFSSLHSKQMSTGVRKCQYMDVTTLVTIQQM